MKASELAYEAARVMAEKGHCKNTLFDDQGRVCFVGALLQAGNEAMYYDIGLMMNVPVNDIMDTSSVILQERGYAAPGYAPSGGRFFAIQFNNDPAVTGEDVIQLLKETGHRLEEK